MLVFCKKIKGNMSKIVMTMPIKPQKETNIGMYIDPRLMNVLSDILSCDSVMAINLLIY